MKALFWRRPRGFKRAKLRAERDARPLCPCFLRSGFDSLGE